MGAQILHLACVESTAFCVQTGKCPIESVSVSPGMSPGMYKIVTNNIIVVVLKGPQRPILRSSFLTGLVPSGKRRRHAR